MRIQVFDIGNSHLKCDIWEILEAAPAKLVYNHHTPTSRNMSENLKVIYNAYHHNEKEGVIVISMSDNTVWESPEGYVRWLPAQEPTHEYARLEELPPYQETGKPKKEILNGVFNHLQLIKTQINSRMFGKKVRILPMSGFVASSLADEKSFNHWDLTHASNSGVFNYQISNVHDPRFPKSGWHSCIADILERGWIHRNILPSSHILKAPDKTPIVLGGHDSTFANALHGIHSSKPYVSCGTWWTASVESELSRHWKDEGARYIVAPNGSILKQLCRPAIPHENAATAKTICRFFSNHLIKETQSPIRVFGAWRETMYETLCSLNSGFEFELMHENYLSEQAARYAAKCIQEHYE